MTTFDVVPHPHSKDHVLLKVTFRGRVLCLCICYRQRGSNSTDDPVSLEAQQTRIPALRRKHRQIHQIAQRSANSSD